MRLFALLYAFANRSNHFLRRMTMLTSTEAEFAAVLHPTQQTHNAAIIPERQFAHTRAKTKTKQNLAKGSLREVSALWLLVLL